MHLERVHGDQLQAGLFVQKGMQQHLVFLEDAALLFTDGFVVAGRAGRRRFLMEKSNTVGNREVTDCAVFVWAPILNCDLIEIEKSTSDLWYLFLRLW